MLIRACFIIAKLAPFLWVYLTQRRLFVLFGPSRRIKPERHQALARRLRERIASLGPTFIKLSQIISSRADVLPQAYLVELRRLQDEVPPIETSLVRSVIEEELGKAVEDVFQDLSEEALAAASLGQVHRAVYRGEQVVVKVLRPGVEEVINTDLRITRRLLGILTRLFSSHHLVTLSRIVDEFARIIREEMDFTKEAANIETFRRNFKANPNLVVPEVYPELNTRRVLVLRFYQGTRVDMLAAGTGIDVARVLENLVEIYGQQVLLDGFFHADPHPGNILITQEGKIVLVDYGMVITIEEEMRQHLVRIAMAAAERDVDTVMESFYALGLVDPEVSFAVVRDAAQTVMDIFDRRTISQKRIQEVTEEILETFYTFPLRLPSHLVYLFKTAVVLEGLGLNYDPTYNLLTAGTPVVERMAGRLMAAGGRSPLDQVFDRLLELQEAVRSFTRVVRAADKEQLRVRLHPMDMEELEAILQRMDRRHLLSMVAVGIAMITTVLYIQLGSMPVLLAGYGIGAILVSLALVGTVASRKRVNRLLAGRFRKGMLREINRHGTGRASASGGEDAG